MSWGSEGPQVVREHEWDRHAFQPSSPISIFSQAGNYQKLLSTLRHLTAYEKQDGSIQLLVATACALVKLSYPTTLAVTEDKPCNHVPESNDS